MTDGERTSLKPIPTTTAQSRFASAASQARFASAAGVPLVDDFGIDPETQVALWRRCVAALNGEGAGLEPQEVQLVLRALDAAERGRDTVRAEAKLYRAVLEFYLNEYARARFVLATPREESFSPEMELLLREFKEGKKTGDRR